MIRAVVVEDEPLALRYLKGLLADTGKVEVVGEALDGAGGFRACVETAPDAAFLDIEVPGSDGLCLAGRLLALPRPPLVVFVTAHSGHALDAFEVEAVDFLLKPIDPEQVLRAVRRLEHRLGPTDVAVDGPPCDRLPIRVPGDSVVRLLSRRDVLAAIRRGRRSWLHTTSEELATHQPLNVLAVWLGGPPFAQVARDAIVNLEAVSEVFHLGARRYQVRLPDRRQTLVEVSRSGAARIAPFLKPPI